MGDDIGWWKISYNNRDQMGYRTPNIDCIANEGIAFTDYYGQQSCTAGRAQLYIDRILAGQIEMAVTTPMSYGVGGSMSVGLGTGSPVTSDYKAPFPYTGKLYKVTVDVSGELIKDDELTMRKIMVRQYNQPQQKGEQRESKL